MPDNPFLQAVGAYRPQSAEAAKAVAGGVKAQGRDAAQLGQLFAELHQRGLAGGGDQKQQVQHFEGMAHAAQGMRDIFAEAGNPFASARQMTNAMTQITGGQMHQMTPQQIEQHVRTAGALTKTTGKTFNEMAEMTQNASNMAASHGMNRMMGVQAAQSSAAWGNAYMRAGGPGGGFGSLGKDQAQNLDTELRLSAAKSTMATQMGGVMAMAEQGLLGDEGAALIKASPEERNKKLSGMMEGGGAGLMDKLQKMGADKGVAAQFLSSDKANQREVAKFGLGDAVRAMQGQEVKGMVMEQLQGDLMSGAKGGTRQERRKNAADQAEKLTKAMSEIAEENPAALSDPQKRNEALQKKGIAVNAQTAGALRALDERIASDPDMAKFGNLGGLMGMNAKGVQQQAAGDLGKAQKNAEQAAKKAEPGAAVKEAEKKRAGEIDEITKGIEKGKEVPKDEKAEDKKKREEGVKKLEGMLGGLQNAGLEQKAGGRQNITINGNLTIKADGNAEMVAQGQGAAPGGD